MRRAVDYNGICVCDIAVHSFNVVHIYIYVCGRYIGFDPTIALFGGIRVSALKATIKTIRNGFVRVSRALNSPRLELSRSDKLFYRIIVHFVRYPVITGEAKIPSKKFISRNSRYARSP